MHDARDSPILSYHIIFINHPVDCRIVSGFLQSVYDYIQEPLTVQQDGLIAKSVVCLAFSMSHSISKKTTGRCA